MLEDLDLELGTHLAHVLIPSKLSAAVYNQPDKLWEGELETSRGSFFRRVVEPLPHPKDC